MTNYTLQISSLASSILPDSQEITRLIWNLKASHPVHISTPLTPILMEIHSVQTVLFRYYNSARFDCYAYKFGRIVNVSVRVWSSEKHTQTHTHSHAHTYTHSHAHTHTDSHTDTLTRTYTHTHTLSLSHAHSRTHTYKRRRTHIHSRTLTLTHTHAQSHSRTLTYSQIRTYGFCIILNVSSSNSRYR